MIKNEVIDEIAEDFNEIVVFAKTRIAEYVRMAEKEAVETEPSQFQEIKKYLSSDDNMKETRTAAELLEIQFNKYKISIENGVFYPLCYIIQQFHLSSLEAECVIFALLPELDTSFGRIYQRLNMDKACCFLTLGLFARIEQFSVQEEYAFLRKFMQSSFFYFIFLNQNKEETAPLSCIPLRINDRFRDFLLGQMYEDDQLNGYVERLLPEEETTEVLLMNDYTDEMLEYESSVCEKNHKLVFCLYGPKGSGKRANLKRYANKKEREIIILRFYMLSGEEERDRILARYLMELYLTSSLACIDITGVEAVERKKLERILTRFMDCFIMLEETDALQPIEEDGFELVSLHCKRPDEKQNHAIWEQLCSRYPLDPDILVTEFSNRFTFTPGILQEVLEEAYRVTRWNKTKQIQRETLLDCSRRHADYRMSDKAKKTDCFFGWEDLILPTAQKEKLLTACRQVISRYQVYIEWGFQNRLPYGNGISMLFYGSPGTGKTMAAQVIAKELGMELYKVDLACIVSKFVGETEKNLKEIFEQAGESKNILFFDEADVLFGKRTEVKDASDKYSNMEAAYLLQKMEEYSGISILATNYLQNIDDAFRRRLKFIVEFPFPSVSERKKIWEGVYPNEVPIEESIDFNYLAETFELSPSSIKNAALYSAYLASWQKERVSMYHIVQGVRNEMLKSGKNLSKEELGEYNMFYEKQ